MTPASLKAWREQLYGTGYGTRSKQKAAKSLGLSQRAYDSYEAGEHRIPRYIELACMALQYDTPIFVTFSDKCSSEPQANDARRFPIRHEPVRQRNKPRKV